MISSLLEEAPPGERSASPAPAFESPVRPGLTAATAEPAAEDDVFLFPATLAQRRFWLLDQLVSGGNPALNVPLALRLRGRLDHAALERAFNEILRRHESLRTTFHSECGQLFQAIAPTLKMIVPVVDVQDFPAAERAQVPDHLLTEEMNQPFDLARGPLLRARLVRLAPEHHLLLFPLHHIVADGWSNGVLTRELGAIYAAFAQGKPSPLAELPVQFADFAQWQQNVLAGGGFDAQLDYWRARLAGELPVLDLPVDRPRRPWRGQAAPGGVCSRRLPGELSQAIKALAVREAASAFMVMLAAFTVLLNRYSGGQEDVLIGTSSANRDRLEVENLIGLFVNPLLLRVNLSGAPTFRELLGRVRGIVLDAFEHSDAPFEKLVEELQPRRLQVNFLYQNAFVQPARLPDLELTPLSTGSPGALFEWMAAAVEDPEGITVSLEYNADLFDASTIDRVLASYEHLLEAVATAAGLDGLVRDLPLHPPVETAAGATVLHAERRRLPAASLPWIERALETAAANGPARTRPGVTLRLLDRHLQPVPAGVVGEIYVDGPTGDRLKTGDLGRQRPDAALEWIGPVDGQRRINGLRVDSRALEAALRAHPHVCDAVILWRADAQNTPRMTAYFVSDGAPAALVSPAQLRAYLKESLAEEVIPSAFVPLEAFPLTPDGRLDEARLPAAPPPAGAPAEATYDTPYLTLHHQIIDIWRELLGARSINIRDDFFALGGNSLLAMRMLYQIEQSFGKTLLPATLFRHATVEHLADEILKHNDGEASPDVVKVQEQGAKTPIFFLHGDISGGGFYCRKLSRDLGPDQPFYALPPVELSNPLEDRPSVEEMAAAHLKTIRTVRPHGPYVIGGFCLGGIIGYEVARQLAAQGETVERLLVIDVEPKNRRLEMLRRMTERLGRVRGLDANRQLYCFCRWHYWLARLDRFRRLTAKARAAALWGRLRGRAQTPVPTASSTRVVEESETSWFDPRLDVPLVFLWAMGGYEAKPYPGRMTLLLSSDLLGGTKDGGKPTRAWRRLVPLLETKALAGRHLECITEHVAGLAQTIRLCLEQAAA